MLFPENVYETRAELRSAQLTTGFNQCWYHPDLEQAAGIQLYAYRAILNDLPPPRLVNGSLVSPGAVFRTWGARVAALYPSSERIDLAVEVGRKIRGAVGFDRDEILTESGHLDFIRDAVMRDEQGCRKHELLKSLRRRRVTTGITLIGSLVRNREIHEVGDVLVHGVGIEANPLPWSPNLSRQDLGYDPGVSPFMDWHADGPNAEQARVFERQVEGGPHRERSATRRIEASELDAWIDAESVKADELEPTVYAATEALLDIVSQDGGDAVLDDYESDKNQRLRRSLGRGHFLGVADVEAKRLNDETKFLLTLVYESNGAAGREERVENIFLLGLEDVLAIVRRAESAR